MRTSFDVDPHNGSRRENLLQIADQKAHQHQ